MTSLPLSARAFVLMVLSATCATVSATGQIRQPMTPSEGGGGTGPAQANTRLLLQLPGIPGESLLAGYQGWHEVDRYVLEKRRIIGGTPAQIAVSPLSIGASFGSALPGLLLRCAAGHPIADVTLHVVTMSPSIRPRIVFRLSEVRVQASIRCPLPRTTTSRTSPGRSIDAFSPSCARRDAYPTTTAIPDPTILPPTTPASREPCTAVAPWDHAPAIPSPV